MDAAGSGELDETQQAQEIKPHTPDAGETTPQEDIAPQTQDVPSKELDEHKSEAEGKENTDDKAE